MSKVNLDTIKPWITRKITDILRFEDDVVIDFIFNQLDVQVTLIILNPYFFVPFEKIIH